MYRQIILIYATSMLSGEHYAFHLQLFTLEFAAIVDLDQKTQSPLPLIARCIR